MEAWKHLPTNFTANVDHVTVKILAYNMSGRKRRYCEHCGENVSERTYKRHKEEFFNATTGEWRKQRARRLDVPVLQDSDAEDDNIITGT